ncbi:hypothetical protein [Fructilactobacillus frigidiflavus]|uniref:hypothetical protein n=1 Tax=Fructilactobacillus frigidiflavus TaxID=3242688 RepID=UPI003757C02E
MLVNVPFEIDADGIHDLKAIHVTLPSGEVAELDAVTLDDINRDHEYLLILKKDPKHEIGKPGDQISFDDFGEKNSFPTNQEIVFMAVPRS